jgi:hypothetical protein
VIDLSCPTLFGLEVVLLHVVVDFIETAYEGIELLLLLSVSSRARIHA